MSSSQDPSQLDVSTETPADASTLGQEMTRSRTARRPYQRPGFIVSQAFERQALSCAGCLNQSNSFPAFCAMRS